MVKINQNKVIRLVKSMRNIVVDEEYYKDVRLKGKADFVTAVDLRISTELKGKLKELYPEIGFLSEEEDGQLSDPCWILDPIDGTANLVYGMKQSSISLGLYSEGRIIFGVVYNPYSRECYHASLGKGAYLGKKKLQVSNRVLSDSIIEVGVASTHKEWADTTFKIIRSIFDSCLDIRRICSSALDLCYMADGRIDGYVEPSLQPWDIAAGSLILEEAGGQISDYQGNPIDFSKKTSVLASNNKIHKDLQDILKESLGENHVHK